MIVYILGGDVENPESRIYACAKVSYGSNQIVAPTDVERVRAFIKARIKEGHESILEHCSLTFKIVGISRACSHQLVRHRLASYTQESQRYVEMDSLDVVCPKSIEDSFLKDYWDSIIVLLEEAYRRFSDNGIPIEDARYILPNATFTTIAVTMNFRELRHFFSLRCDRHAQWEIRELANKMLKLAYKIAPSVFQDLIERYVIE